MPIHNLKDAFELGKTAIAVCSIEVASEPPLL